MLKCTLIASLPQAHSLTSTDNFKERNMHVCWNPGGNHGTLKGRKCIQTKNRLWDWRALTRPAKPIVVFYNYRWWRMCHSKNMARLFISKLNIKLKKLISVCGDFGVQCIWTWWCVLKCRNRRPSHDEKNRTSGESQPWLSPISTNWLYCMQFEPWSSFSNCTRTECRTIVVLSKFFFQASKSLAFCLSKWLNHHDWHPKASCFAFVQ